MLDTYGWDTVFVVDLPLLNSLLTKETFRKASVTFSSSGDTEMDSSITWQNADAQVDQLYGSQVRVVFEIAQGTLTSPVTTVDLAGWAYGLTVNFALIRGAGAAQLSGPASGTSSSLDPWANVQITAPDGASEEAQELVYDGLVQYLTLPESLSDFMTLFSEMKFPSSAGADDPLGPKVARIAGAHRSDGSGIVACLARTRDNDVTGLPIQLSPTALAQDQRAAFLVSGDCFLSKFVLPALAGAYGSDPTTVETDFPIADGSSVGNTVPLTLNVPDRSGTLHKATIAVGNFRLECADVIKLTMRDMTISIDLGQMNVFVFKLQYSEEIGVKLVDDPKVPGRKVLLFTSLGDPNVTHDIEESIWLSLAEGVTQIILGIIEGLASRAVFTKVIGSGASRLVSYLISALVAFLISGISQTIAHTEDIVRAIEKGDFSGLPSFSLILNPALAAVSWGRSVVFDPASVALSGGLVCTLNVSHS
jgi:hypothetical protein